MGSTGASKKEHRENESLTIDDVIKMLDTLDVDSHAKEQMVERIDTIRQIQIQAEVAEILWSKGRFMDAYSVIHNAFKITIKQMLVMNEEIFEYSCKALKKEEEEKNRLYDKILLLNLKSTEQ
jgi:hypothetical protein